MAARSAERRAPSRSAAPLVTLTTDFGTRDPFVGIMKGVILTIAPAARIVDLTHEVPPQSVVAGAHALASAAPWFPPGTIHVAVVDPGVGTRRRALVVEAGDAYFVGPDNGVLSLAAPRPAVRRIVDVSRSRLRLRPVSRTFHGRDVFAPIAAALAMGTAMNDLGTSVRTMQRLRVPRLRRRGTQLIGTVLWSDGFGNLATSVTAADLASAGFRRPRLSITIAGHVVPFRPSYASVPVGSPVALVNSSSLLEIAVNHGTAVALLGAGPGTRVTVGVA
jgi:S-adenosylmethionine hydrolase